MRFRHLQNIFSAIILAFLTLMSCTHEEIPEGEKTPSVDGHVISFGVKINPVSAANQVKGKGAGKYKILDDKTLNDYSIEKIKDINEKYGGHIGLFTVYTGTDEYNSSKQYPTDKFIYYNDCLTLEDDNGRCSIDKERYWPQNDDDSQIKEKLSFFAMVPYYSVADLHNINPYHIAEGHVIDEQNPFIHYDPLYSNNCVNLVGENNKKVNLEFKHAMAKFTFRIKAGFSAQEKKDFMQKLTGGAYNPDYGNYYYYNCDAEGIYATRWKIMDVDLLFLVDKVKIENIRSEACMNIMSTRDEDLWHIEDGSVRHNLIISQDDLNPKISYSQLLFPRPNEKGGNAKRVWENDKLEINGNDRKWRSSEGILPAPWKEKQSIDSLPGEKAHRLFKKDIHIIPGDYSKKENKIRLTLSYHAVLVGTFQKEFWPKVVYATREDPDAPGWYWYKSDRLWRYPQYRRFYAKINEGESKKIGPVDIQIDRILPNKHYDATLGIGVKSATFDISLKEWDVQTKHEVIDDKKDKIPEFETPIKWTFDGLGKENCSITEGMDVQDVQNPINENLTKINLQKGSYAIATFNVPKLVGAKVLVNVIPIKGDPGCFSFEDVQGIPKFSLDGNQKTFKIKCNGGRHSESRFILRFYIEFTDGTHKILFGMNRENPGDMNKKDAGEYILNYNESK